jgi:hypothetical protein
MNNYVLYRLLSMNMAFNTKAVDIELLNERRKLKLIRELINTEKSFLNHLDLILDVSNCMHLFSIHIIIHAFLELC